MGRRQCKGIRYGVGAGVYCQQDEGHDGWCFEESTPCIGLARSLALAEQERDRLAEEREQAKADRDTARQERDAARARADRAEAACKKLSTETDAAVVARERYLHDRLRELAAERDTALEMSRTGRAWKKPPCHDDPGTESGETWAEYADSWRQASESNRAKRERAEAERDAAREALRSLLAEPHGCSFCDYGKTRNPAKGHQPDCAHEAARIIIAKAEDRS